MKKIALLIETSRAYGRNLLSGVAQFAQSQHDWLMRLMTPEDLHGRCPFAGFDGIIARTVNTTALRKISASGLPTVDMSHEQKIPKFLAVGSHDHAIGIMAANFFLGHSFRNFAFCGFKGMKFSDIRRDSFKKIISGAGFQTNEFSFPEPMTDAFFYGEKFDDMHVIQLLRKWVQSVPPQTAVFCANDMRAYQLIRAATAESIRIPHDLAVLGSDNDNLICLFSTPPLSSINPNAEGVGYAAARILHAAMQDPSAAQKRRHKPFHAAPGELIERASTEFYPISPSWLSDLLVFIGRNIAHPLSASDVVAHSGRSYPTVEKAFAKAFGETIGQYITRVKMNEARRLITLGRHSSKEIASLTGFSSPQYFCNAYRRFFGYPPFAGRPISLSAETMKLKKASAGTLLESSPS